MFTYSTTGTCSRQIQFEVIDNKLHNVRFAGGCNGNLQGVSRLVEGRDLDEVIALLEGVQCRNNTSCPDQLAQAVKAYKKSVESKA